MVFWCKSKLIRFTRIQFTRDNLCNNINSLHQQAQFCFTAFEKCNLEFSIFMLFFFFLNCNKILLSKIRFCLTCIRLKKWWSCLITKNNLNKSWVVFPLMVNNIFSYKTQAQKILQYMGWLPELKVVLAVLKSVLCYPVTKIWSWWGGKAMLAHYSA